MDLKEQLLSYKQMTQTEADRQKMQETAGKAKEAFYKAEQEAMLSYHEFLWTQFKILQKKWWVFQFLLLCAAGSMFVSSHEESYIWKGLGVMAVLFVILIIPELWKNRTCQSMEIEEASFYSLKQIYAARMVLFGAVDMLLLTAFCGTMTLGLHLEFMQLLVQFLLPMLVTACICFGTLCSRRNVNENAAIFLCILWSLLWLALTFNEKVYAMVTMPVWLLLTGCSFVFLCAAVYRSLHRCEAYWEVVLDGIGIE